MIKTATALSILTLAGGCDKPDEAPTCPSLRLIAHAPLQTYVGQLERADICVKTTAHELTRAGGPPADAARAALARCAPDEAAAIVALRHSGPVYGYQRQIIHDGLTHLATIAAIQARSTGCGRKPGQPADTPDTD